MTSYEIIGNEILIIGTALSVSGVVDKDKKNDSVVTFGVALGLWQNCPNFLNI